jgi:branched-chain amino acid transport system permease protein
MNGLLLALVLGLTEGLVFTLLSLGLALTYGMMRIVNMAHGAFFMFGAFMLATFLRAAKTETIVWLLLATLGATVLAGILGLILERTVYARMYSRSHVSGLLGTFALMIAIQGAVQSIWGEGPQAVRVPTVVQDGSVRVGGVQIPYSYLIIIGVAVVALVLTGALLFATNLGLWTRAIAADRRMAALLGANVGWIFAGMFAVGSCLAGLAGALMAPIVQVDPTLASTYIISAFAVVLVGGLGSLRGCLIAGLVLGLVDAFLAVEYQSLAGYGIYVAMIVSLVWRPRGLFGQAMEGRSGEVA